MTIPNIDPQMVKDLVLPGLAGAAGGGGLAGYMASQDAREGEAPGERRRRIMRNALMGTALGGLTGAALPQGVKMLSQPFRNGGKSPGIFSRGLDGATDFGMGHAFGLGALGVGGLGTLAAINSNRGAALRRILSMVQKDKALTRSISGKAGELAPDVLHSFMSASPENRAQVMHLVDSAMTRNDGRGYAHMANELFNEAGFKGTPFGQRNRFDDFDFDSMHTKAVPGRIAESLKEHLGQDGRGIMSHLVSRIADGTGPLLGEGGTRMSKGIADLMPAWVPEGIANRLAAAPSGSGYHLARRFSETFRPSIRGSEGISRFSPTTMTAATLGGAGMADELQNRFMGN